MAARRVIEATTALVQFDVEYAGETAMRMYGNPLPPFTLASIRRNGVALKGPLGTPISSGRRSLNVELRTHFDLYVNMRPVRSFIGVKSRYENIDLVIFRENTEEFYTAEESYLTDSEGKIIGAESKSRVTIAGSIRFFNRVFEHARKIGRKRITIGHKGNIFKLLHGEMFLDQATEYAADLNAVGIRLDSEILDALMMKLVLNPNRFDVIAAPNLPGDLLSDLCAGFIGGLGLAPGANIGDDVAIFEAVHGTAPDIVGKGIANPTAVILSAAMMLDHIGEKRNGDKIRKAVAEVIAEGVVTPDLKDGSGVTTTTMTDAIIKKLKRA